MQPVLVVVILVVVLEPLVLGVVLDITCILAHVIPPAQQQPTFLDPYARRVRVIVIHAVMEAHVQLVVQAIDCTMLNATILALSPRTLTLQQPARVVEVIVMFAATQQHAPRVVLVGTYIITGASILVQ